MVKTKRVIRDIEFSMDEYFANPDNFTVEQWERMEKRKALCGVGPSTAIRTQSTEKPKIAEKKRNLSKRKNKWIPLR